MLSPLQTGARWRTLLLVVVGYVGLSVAYTWPLLPNLFSALPSDAGDPSLNASILQWNATHIPFSAAWWDAPHYMPAHAVAAFTENLQGISLFATPIYWLTGSTIATYNVAYFITWPLSGIAMWLLVERLTRRSDAAFLAGLAFAFTPYRTAAISHIQTLSIYWLPVALLAAHAFLNDGRRVWLAVFAVSWVVQSLCNGHYLLFGGVLIGMWLVYFGSTREARPRLLTLGGIWFASSIPLVPVLLTYSRVHEEYGLKRTLAEILAYSARPHSWFETTGDAWFWHQFLPAGKDALFPGLTAVALLTVGCALMLWKTRARTVGARVWFARVVYVVVAVSGAATVAGMRFGPWTLNIGRLVVRMADLSRALPLLVVASIAAGALHPGVRAAWTRRSPLLFYTAAIFIIALFCTGPVLHVGDVPMLSPAPYRALMLLPGFDELRVPPRFWMLGVMCLATAAGLAFARLSPAASARTRAAAAIIGAFILLDGWMPTMRMVAAPADLAVEATTGQTPILELPLGADWDWDAVYRAARHQRRLFNGVSGYDPPHYDALRTGQAVFDPGIISAVASLGAVDVVINPAADPEGRLQTLVEATPGARFVTEAEGRRLYRVAQTPSSPTLGPSLPIASVQAVRASELFAERKADTPELHDGRVNTGWTDFPQQPGQWVVIDLGETRDVAGVSQTLGRASLAYPRRLQIQTSNDATAWEPAWEGATTAEAFLSLVREPLVGTMRFGFPARRARYVRVLQVDSAPREWHIADLAVYAPER